MLEDLLAINLNPDDPNEFDNNNYKARAIDIIGNPVPPKPDLQVTSITTSSPGSVDAPFTVTWIVTNTAEGDATGSWIDLVLLHDLPDPDTPGAKVWTLGAFGRSGTVASLASYVTTQHLALSPAASPSRG